MAVYAAVATLLTTGVIETQKVGI